MTTLVTLLRRGRPESGATMVEYALLVAFIALVALVGITLIGSNLQSFFSSVANNL
ncbi:Flp family type IVb pilin [Humibacillus xanthopallidus]|uniref:Pilus assembly protein Flp/PilA n=1 Tax=Humibacillus xanthopallidus TaxID=412689 RepID=A0A543I1U3_9MICO|nr:Flp family type IVb pilin [Humibacillus xanthopallidus]TQM64554.1 pilus assembly protein Flp/PilA [Humibacillus xanthopallidus]